MIRRFFWATLLVLVALAVRLPSLTDRSWWIDELITRDIGRLPFYKPGAFSERNYFTHSKVGFAIHDTGPGPLMYVLDGALAGGAEPLATEYLLRIPGIIAGLALVVVVLIGLWRTGAYGAVLAAALAAVLPGWVDWSTGARGYSWALLCGMLQMILVMHFAGKPRGGLRVAAGMFGTLGVFIHPFHIFYNAALWAALAIVRPYRQWRWIAGGAMLLALQGAWLVLWMRCVNEVSPDGFAGGKLSLAGIAPAIAKLLQTEWLLCLGLMALLVTGLGVLLRSSRSRLQLVGAVAVLMAGIGLLLSVIMTMRFFTAGRYFYAATIPGLLLVAFLAARVTAWVRLRAGRRVSRGVGLAASLVAIGVFFYPAMRTADSPVHDWAAAARWLKQQTAPGDVVLTGPNSEYEVYRVYARAAQMTAVSPLTISNSRGDTISVQTPLAIDALIKNGRRLWFITAFYGHHRTPEYWQLIDQHFQPKARFPGKAELVVLSNQ